MPCGTPTCGRCQKVPILLVPGEGIEPPTNGLQNRCSTAELTRQRSVNTHFFCSRKRTKDALDTILDIISVPQDYVDCSCGLAIVLAEKMSIDAQGDVWL